MEMRPYQQDGFELTMSSFQSHNAVLVVMATGLGKTILFSHIAKEFIPRGRIMMIAHREELITQGKEKMDLVTGTEASIEMGDRWALDGGFLKSDIVCSSIQTQNAGMRGEGRMTRFDPNEFSLLVVDEAHHATAASYQRMIQYYQQNPDLKVLGVTATPDRTDEMALGKIFSDVSFEYDIRDGINHGWLVPVSQQMVHVEGLDLSSVKTQAGDLNGRQLAEVMEFEENLHAVASPTIELCGDRKTLVFTASVAQAERLTEILNRHKGGCANFVCGKTPKDIRRMMLADYAEKKFQYLVNVGVATEGFDDPDIEVVVMARPTKSRCLYTQMAGRGTRPASNIAMELNTFAAEGARKALIARSDKPQVEIIDFVGNSGRHKLVHAPDILGGIYEDDVVDMVNKNMAAAGKPADVMTELMKAESEMNKRLKDGQDAQNRHKLRVRAKYSTAKVNPFDVFDMNPNRERAWHKNKPATPGQLKALANFKVDAKGPVNGYLSFTHASQLLDKLCTRANDQLCTFKQANFLRKRGIDPAEVRFNVASKVVDAYAKNNWRKPANLQQILAENVA